MQLLLADQDAEVQDHFMSCLANRRAETLRSREKRARRRKQREVGSENDAIESSDSADSDDEDPMPEYTLAALEHIEATRNNTFGVAADSKKRKEQKRNAMAARFAKAIGADHVLTEEAEETKEANVVASVDESAVSQHALPAIAPVDGEHSSAKSNLPEVRRFVPDRPCAGPKDACQINWIQGARGEHWVARYTFSLPGDVSKPKKEMKQNSRTKFVSSDVSEHSAFQHVLSWLWAKHNLCTSEPVPLHVTEFLKECPQCKEQTGQCTAMSALKKLPSNQPNVVASVLEGQGTTKSQ